MDRKDFDSAIKTLELDTQTVCTKALRTLSLWPKYNTLQRDKFLKICKWLSENYKPYGGRFPTLAYFEHARLETSSYSPNTFTHYKNINYAIADIAESFQEVKKCLPKKQVKAKKSQRELYRKMAEKNFVYFLIPGVWDQKGSRNGKYIDPKEKI